MASASLSGKWCNAAVLMLIYYLLAIAVSSLSGSRGSSYAVQLLFYFLLSPMLWGVSVAFLDVARGSEVDYGNLFAGYHDFQRIAVTSLVRYVI